VLIARVVDVVDVDVAAAVVVDPHDLVCFLLLLLLLVLLFLMLFYVSCSCSFF
jgi:hypothetical protein